jgi:hypothetical protein
MEGRHPDGVAVGGTVDEAALSPQGRKQPLNGKNATAPFHAAKFRHMPEFFAYPSCALPAPMA